MDCQMYHVPQMPQRQQIPQMPQPPQMPIPQIPQQPVPFRSIEMNTYNESKLESKFNMYERQIDQLFEFAYQSKDEIQVLFKMKDKMTKSIEIIESNINVSELKQYKECIINYYHLEIENKKRMAVIEFYQFLLFIVQIIIIITLCLVYKLV